MWITSRDRDRLTGARAGSRTAARSAAPYSFHDLSTEMSTILAIAALAISLISLLTAILAWGIARYRVGSEATAAEFARLEAELTDQASAIDGVRKAMVKIRARLNAQSKRTAQSGEPEYDLSTEAGRTEARRALESRLAANGQLHSRAHRG